MKVQAPLARAAFILFALVIAGCASQAPKIDLNADAAGGLDTITLVRPPKKLELGVQNLAHPGMMFGAIGGLVAAADGKNKSEQLNKALGDQGFSLSDTLTAAVERK